MIDTIISVLIFILVTNIVFILQDFMEEQEDKESKFVESKLFSILKVLLGSFSFFMLFIVMPYLVFKFSVNFIAWYFQLNDDYFY